MQSEQKTGARILKVNHAGEHGAIRIYGAQILVARKLYPEIVDKLTEMRGHEIEHLRLFNEAMIKQSTRPCRALFLWAWGGWCLGLVTALLGRRMIWICTEAVEQAVHHHLDDQLRYLKSRNLDLHQTILSIQSEELSHLENARTNRGAIGTFNKIAVQTVATITDILIWMSTSGDSAKLAREMESQN